MIERIRPLSPSTYQIGSYSVISYPDLTPPWALIGIVVFKRRIEPNSQDWKEPIKEDLRKLVGAWHLDVMIPVQVHGTKVIEVGLAESDLCSDGLVTSLTGKMLCVSTADCVPLLAYDTKKRVIGVAHCGWRGTLAGICGSFMRVLKDCGASPSTSVFLLGPSIGVCCYEFGRAIVERLSRAEVGSCIEQRQGRTYLDLKKLVVMRLLASGAHIENIWVDKTCTACKKDILCSWRASGEHCGRMISFIVKKE